MRDSLSSGPHAFGRFVLDPRERRLLHDGAPVALTPKVFDLLCLLVEQRGHIVTKDEIMNRIWAGTVVEEANLVQSISVLRRALRQDDSAQYIETVSRFGYRFIANVTDNPKSSPGVKTHPETHYARSGDVNIAYQTIGDGPIDLVFVMGWVSHLEYFWTEPTFARFLETLASFSRLILLDKRGTGLSDRVPLSDLPTLEQRMDDVRAVMDAVGSEHAVIVGVSEGGPMSALFAATYPEKTLALVMIGSYARRLKDENYPWGPTLAEREAFLGELQHNWGGPIGLEERAPSRSHDPEFREWWATYLRMGASPGAAIALTRMNMEIDVRHVLPLVTVPSLVLHRRGDRCLKIEEGAYLSSLMPNSEFIALPGEDHLPFVGNQQEILNPLQRFLSQIQRAGKAERVLATVLYLHTEHFDEPLRASAKREIQRFRGHQMQSGAATLATFDGPARAIRCADAVLRLATDHATSFRAGLHTGECERVGSSTVRGTAVEIAADVLAEAKNGEILVSSTVKDLVAGSGISFQALPLRAVKSPYGNWSLFHVTGCSTTDRQPRATAAHA